MHRRHSTISNTKLMKRKSKIRIDKAGRVRSPTSFKNEKKNFGQLKCMWMPTAIIKIVIMQKYKTAWMRMAIPLVYMFPNSIILVLAGSWKRSPGDKRMNKTTETITGPQSALIFLSLFILLSEFLSQIGSLKNREFFVSCKIVKKVMFMSIM